MVEKVLKQFDKFLYGEACLLDDGSQGFALEVPVMISDGDARDWTIRVLEDVVGAGAVVDEKSGPFQGTDDLFGFDDG